MNISKRLALSAAVALLFSACATASTRPDTVRLEGTLSGAQEVPPVNTRGTGTLDASFHKPSRKLAYTVTYSGLTGPATGAHFHGPADQGQNAGVVIPLSSTATPIRGEVTLTQAQASDLLAGRWYVNVHTSAHPGGEVRAQVVPQ